MKNDGSAPYEERNTTDLMQPRQIERAGPPGRSRATTPGANSEPTIIGTSDDDNLAPLIEDENKRLNVAQLRDMNFNTEYETEPRDPSMGVRPYVEPNPVTRPNTPMLENSALDQQKVNPFQVDLSGYDSSTTGYLADAYPGGWDFSKGYSKRPLTKADTGAKRP